MPIYDVSVPEVYMVTYRVPADDEDTALAYVNSTAFQKGECNDYMVEESMEYSHTLDATHATSLECEGHPADEFSPMGETTYCDGSCRNK